MTQANLEALTREVERQSAIVDCKNLMGKVYVLWGRMAQPENGGAVEPAGRLPAGAALGHL